MRVRHSTAELPRSTITTKYHLSSTMIVAISQFNINKHSVCEIPVAVGVFPLQAPTFKMLSMAQTNDLLMGHGYGVTAVKRVTFTGTPVHSVVKQDKLNLIRLRDPWSALGWTGFFGRRYVMLACSEPFLSAS